MTPPGPEHGRIMSNSLRETSTPAGPQHLPGEMASRRREADEVHPRAHLPAALHAAVPGIRVPTRREHPVLERAQSPTLNVRDVEPNTRRRGNRELERCARAERVRTRRGELQTGRRTVL